MESLINIDDGLVGFPLKALQYISTSGQSWLSEQDSADVG